MNGRVHLYSLPFNTALRRFLLKEKRHQSKTL